MALLGSCFCCSLVRGTIVTAAYTAVVYLAAFILQLYWIVQAHVSLPAPAYIQAASYLVTMVMSVILCVGVFIKRCQLLLGWLFVMILFWLPECGLVILMSVHHWGLVSPNGTLEISFWVCRATVNILGIVCVHSLYSSWKDEKSVMRRLHNLNMTSVLPDHGKDNNGNVRDLQSKGVPSVVPPYNGYRNHGYVGTNDFLSPSKANNKNRMVSRSASSVSYLHYNNNNNNQNGVRDPSHHHEVNGGGGIFISNDDLRRLEHIHAIHQILAKNQRDKSEFNPYALSSSVIHSSRTNVPDPASLPPYSSSFSDLHSYRPRSLGGEGNYASRQFTSTRGQQPCSVHPDFSTQSLDRSKYLRLGRRKRGTSLEDLDIKLSSDDITLEKMQHRPFDYLNRPGSRQASEVGSEFERIKDVAL